ncbi:FtsX-like permease family protein [Taylorella equigenitalis]|uniref:FtsX-like permease family protein n=2 Tax=Taylorella equigenitalis TaxID=29575 RepID=UPI00237CF025|nr:FtsX-like permease family protein [Taylorella equigenitalis]WDU54690.1 FtsX-like permease family protein [Taylorella equigenitalis]
MLSKISLKELFHKPFQTILLIILIALSIAASVFFVSLNQGIHGGLVKATEPFPQVVGAKGGINQLLLNTVFLQDRPIGNIPQKVLTDLKANKLVNMAIPLGYGDNYRGFRLVGTSTDIFNYSPKKGGEKWMTLKEGRIWDKPFEAVVGSGVVELTDIKIGDTFKTIHGFSEHSSHQHDNLYTVVGILNKVDGPYDQAILTDMRSIWEAHAHHHHHHDHDDHDHDDHDHDEHDHEGHDHEHDHEHDHDHDAHDDHDHNHEGDVAHDHDDHDHDEHDHDEHDHEGHDHEHDHEHDHDHDAHDDHDHNHEGDVAHDHDEHDHEHDHEGHDHEHDHDHDAHDDHDHDHEGDVAHDHDEHDHEGHDHEHDHDHDAHDDHDHDHEGDVAHDHDEHDHDEHDHEHDHDHDAHDDHDHDHDAHDDHDHDHDGGMTLDKAAKNDVNPIYVNDGNNAATTGEVTAILVQPAGYGEAMKLAQEFQSNKEAQLIFPAQNIIQLFSLMGQGEKFWYYVGGFLILTALALVLLTMYLSSLTRMRERAVLQTLGASRGQLLRISLIQNGFIIILGGIIGYALGMLAFATVSSLTRDKTAVFMPVDFYELPIYIAIGTVILGLIVSIIPAYIISKKDTLKYL